jgi:hypothetical protein
VLASVSASLSRLPFGVTTRRLSPPKGFSNASFGCLSGRRPVFAERQPGVIRILEHCLWVLLFDILGFGSRVHIYCFAFALWQGHAMRGSLEVRALVCIASCKAFKGFTMFSRWGTLVTSHEGLRDQPLIGEGTPCLHQRQIESWNRTGLNRAIFMCQTSRVITCYEAKVGSMQLRRHASLII